MMHKVFIAINLPKEVRKKLLVLQKKLKSDFPPKVIRWIPPENLHITLAFLGSMKEQNLTKLADGLSKFTIVAPFSIILTEPQYYPSRNKAKLIWVPGVSTELLKIKERLDAFLEQSEATNYSTENKFIIHVTLGRTRFFQYNQIPLEEIPLLENNDLNLNFSIDSFELMESKIRKKGPEYIVLKSYPHLQ